MLTKSEYQALQRYLSPVFVSEKDDYQVHFEKSGYIEPDSYDTYSGVSVVGVYADSYKITLAGKLALEEYEAAEAEKAHQKRVDRATIWTAILTGIGIIVSVVSIVTAFLR